MGERPTSDRWISLLPLIPGLALFGIAAFDPRSTAFPTGRAPVAAAGGVFALAGVAIFINSLSTPYRQALLALNSMLLLGSFAAVPIAIAWADGVSAPLVISALACLGIAAMCGRAALKAFRQARRELTTEELTMKGPRN